MATITWTGFAGNAEWNDSNNWNLSVPTVGDTAVFNITGSLTVYRDGPLEGVDVILNSGFLSINSNSLGPDRYIIFGSITTAPGSTFKLQNAGPPIGTRSDSVYLYGSGTVILIDVYSTGTLYLSSAVTLEFDPTSFEFFNVNGPGSIRFSNDGALTNTNISTGIINLSAFGYNITIPGISTTFLYLSDGDYTFTGPIYGDLEATACSVTMVDCDITSNAAHFVSGSTLVASGEVDLYDVTLSSSNLQILSMGSNVTGRVTLNGSAVLTGQQYFHGILYINTGASHTTDGFETAGSISFYLNGGTLNLTNICNANIQYESGSIVNGTFANDLQVLGSVPVSFVSGVSSFKLEPTGSVTGVNVDISSKLIPRGGTIEVTSNTTFASPMSGLGSLNKSGSGTLVLSSPNSFTGGFQLVEGGVKPLNAGSLTSGIFQSNENTVVDLTELSSITSNMNVGGLLKIKI